VRQFLAVQHDSDRPRHQGLDLVVEPVGHATRRPLDRTTTKWISMFHGNSQVSPRCYVLRHQPLPRGKSRWMEIGVGIVTPEWEANSRIGNHGSLPS